MNVKKIKPLGNRVLIKRCHAEVSKGGIILPETAQEAPKQGDIIAVGVGKIDDKGKLQSMKLKIGDKVLFASFSGTEVDDNNEYLIMSEDDVLAVIS
jgi:chaperonin GroES